MSSPTHPTVTAAPPRAMARAGAGASKVAAEATAPLRLWQQTEHGERLPEVTIVVVSYNTRELTLRCLETLLARGGDVCAEVVVYDNASQDGSAEAIAARFAGIRLIRATENVGFARANNIVAAQARAPWLLLLNPDTETYAGAVSRLLAFARANPRAGICGGRTLFPDGSLNPHSCFNRITLRSQLCRTLGIDKLFPQSGVFSPEAMGDWRRDSVRRVDIVVGCFLLISRSLWLRLGGFDLKYFMYGEEADLCLRAAALGYTPMITPQATIMHINGASSNARADKIVLVGQARATLIRDHWPPARVPLGLALLWLWAGLRFAASSLAAPLTGPGGGARRRTWAAVWRQRHQWLKGYRSVEQA
jgi:GT2 family glycosyltransferase